MKLPQQLLQSKFFIFSELSELKAAIGGLASDEELIEIERLSALGLPPIVSREMLGLMLGINPGLIWSIEKHPHRFYRTFSIAKGGGVFRQIQAPRVVLKTIQKWLSVQLQAVYAPPEHVFGFIPGRSHIDAASRHCEANWVFSADIRDFFPSITKHKIESVFRSLGYIDSCGLLSSICCYNGRLAQGSPASPVLSNLSFSEIDLGLLEISRTYNVRLSRYADDIVFSGQGAFPAELRHDLEGLFLNSLWTLAPEKTELLQSPYRLKVHGLLVHGDHVRLTKGYRNRIRAYKHLLSNGKIRVEDKRRIKGHLRYAEHISEHN